MLIKGVFYLAWVLFTHSVCKTPPPTFPGSPTLFCILILHILPFSLALLHSLSLTLTCSRSLSLSFSYLLSPLLFSLSLSLYSCLLSLSRLLAFFSLSFSLSDSLALSLSLSLSLHLLSLSSFQCTFSHLSSVFLCFSRSQLWLVEPARPMLEVSKRSCLQRALTCQCLL